MLVGHEDIEVGFTSRRKWSPRGTKLSEDYRLCCIALTSMDHTENNLITC